MNRKTLGHLIKALVNEQIQLGNVNRLTKKTGLSRSWFYEVASEGIKDPKCEAVYCFLKAIGHKIADEIDNSYLEQVDTNNDHRA